jgi:hypothetical protein
MYVVRLDLRESRYSPTEANFAWSDLRNSFITLYNPISFEDEDEHPVAMSIPDNIPHSPPPPLQTLRHYLFP